MAVLLLEEVDGLEIAEEVLLAARDVPAITWVMDVLVRPYVGQRDCPRRGIDVRECVKNVSVQISAGRRYVKPENIREIVGRDVFREILSPINAPVDEIANALLPMCNGHVIVVVERGSRGW